MAPARETPRWQPLSQLPPITWAIDGMADSAAAQRANLRQAEDRPAVLDDHTVGRLIAVFTQQKADLWLYTEQLARWRSEPLSAAQRAAIERLDGRLTTLAQTIDAILEWAAHAKGRTIEAMLAKPDLELGLETLQGQPTPRTPRGRPRKGRPES